MMSLENQFKVIFFSFIYGMFFLTAYQILMNVVSKKKIIKILSFFLFCIINVLIFYFLLYKINYGMLSYYIIIFLILGMFFCHLLYFKDNNH